MESTTWAIPQKPTRPPSPAAPVQKGKLDRASLIRFMPVAADDFEPFKDYVMVDFFGRAVCIDTTDAAWNWTWAFLGTPSQYQANVAKVKFGVSPFVAPGACPLVEDLNGYRRPLLIDTGHKDSPDSAYTFFGSSSYFTDYPYLTFLASGDMGFFTSKLTLPDGSQATLLQQNTGSWDWLYVGKLPKYTALAFSLAKLVIIKPDIIKIAQDTWPDAGITEENFEFYDGVPRKPVELVPDHVAVQVWNNSGLAGFTNPPGSFYPADYAYIYKSQACKYVYATKPRNAMAIGIIKGTAGDTHVANFYIDYTGTLMIVEPRTGKLVPGSAWADTSSKKYTPVLFEI